MPGASSYPLTVRWGPGYIGLVVAAFLYGIEVCQFVFYLRAFPSDTVTIKFLVYIIAVLDTAHFFVLTAGFYFLLIGCRMNTSPMCSYHVPWIVIFTITLVYCVTFMVQGFYAHRVWIISGRNRAITLAVVVFATLQLVFGLIVVSEVVQTSTNAVLYSTKYVPLSSIASAGCDTIITLSAMYYLRSASIRKETFIKKLLIVFVEAGLFTFINSSAMVILCYTQQHALGQYLSTAPGVILSKSYVNSMLAVLNVRKAIRDEQQNPRTHSIELPTIRTLH